MNKDYIYWKQYFEQKLSDIKIPKIGYVVEGLDYRVDELEVKLRGEEDLNFNREDIENTFRLTLELCINKMNIRSIEPHDFAIDYRRISLDNLGLGGIVQINLLSRSVKSKAFLSAFYSVVLSKGLSKP